MANPKPARILVVDDEPRNIKLLEALLVRQGYTVMTAADGKVALRLAAEQRPDLILLDVMMPVIDGYTVSRRAGETPMTKKIPLLILTAKGQMRDLFTISPNVAAYLDKPFDPKKLRDLVAGILEKKF